MADNYLEKKMEEYRSGKSAAGKFSRKPSQGYFALKMSGLRILLAGAVTPEADVCIRKLAASGCKVAFYDRNRGAGYAQQSGALYIPTDDIYEAFTQAAARWGSIDIVLLTVSIETRIVEILRASGVNRVIGLGVEFTSGLCDVTIALDYEDEAVANLCAVLCHPSTYCLRNILL